MSVAIGPRQTHGTVVRGTTYTFFPGNDTSGMNEAFHPKFLSTSISLFVVIKAKATLTAGLLICGHQYCRPMSAPESSTPKGRPVSRNIHLRLDAFERRNSQ